MKTAFRKSLTRDLKKIKDREVLKSVQEVIREVEAAALQDIRDLKKIAGTTSFFRLRVGDYRIGVVVTDEVVEFIRCLPRRDLYKFFP